MPTLSQLMKGAGRRGAAQLRGFTNAMTMGAAPALAAAPMYAYNQAIGQPLMGDPSMSYGDAYDAARMQFEQDQTDMPNDATIGELLAMGGMLQQPARQVAGGLRGLMQPTQVSPERMSALMATPTAPRRSTEESWKLLQADRLPEARHLQDLLMKKVPEILKTTPKQKPEGLPDYIWSGKALNRDAAQYAADLHRAGRSKEYIMKRMAEVFGTSDNIVLGALDSDAFASPHIREAVWKALHEAGKGK